MRYILLSKTGKGEDSTIFTFFFSFLRLTLDYMCIIQQYPKKVFGMRVTKAQKNGEMETREKLWKKIYEERKLEESIFPCKAFARFFLFTLFPGYFL